MHRALEHRGTPFVCPSGEVLDNPGDPAVMDALVDDVVVIHGNESTIFLSPFEPECAGEGRACLARRLMIGDDAHGTGVVSQ